MYLVLTASKDTYITNKIVNGSFRAEDANVGRAGTLDLFKLFSESTLSGTDNPIEVSRALMQFDLYRVRELTSSILDITSPSFKCTLKMRNITAGQSVPSNFNLSLHPLSQSWDEGIGRDVNSFGDLDVANFVTASYSGGVVYPWNTTGADASGLLGSADIDVISSGTVGAGVENLFVTQQFAVGTEDLVMDVTKIVSATITDQLPDKGWRLAFESSEELDAKTRFVKRFASRHSSNRYSQPMLHVSFDDTLHDHHNSFFFDATGTLFLSNYRRGAAHNVLSGSSLTELVGSNCMHLLLKTGSYSLTVSASMHTGSTTGDGTAGVYSASFCIPFSESTVVDGGSTVHHFAVNSGSLTFDTIWSSVDETVGFLSSSLKIMSPVRTSGNFVSRKPSLRVTNLKSSYKHNNIAKIRVFGRDLANDRLTPSKKPYSRQSVIFDEAYYRVRDVNSGDILIPFQRNQNGTRLSTDKEGMFFEIRMNNLFVGRTYSLEFLVIDRGTETVIEDAGTRFRVDG